MKCSKDRDHCHYTGEYRGATHSICNLKCAHGTTIRTGITYKKILCYMRDSACRQLIVENTKLFLSYVKKVWNVEVFINHRINFLDWENKTKLVVSSFS